MGSACSASSSQEVNESSTILMLEKEKQRQEAHASATKEPVTILLLGSAESGKSTVLKQMKILNLNGFSKEEIISFKPIIRKNLIEAFNTVLHSMKFLNLELSSKEANQRFQEVCQVYEHKNDKQTLHDLKRIMLILLNDKGVIECVARSHEIYLQDSAGYFFGRIDEVMSEDYMPREEDIIRARKVTRGMDQISFTQGSLTINLIDVGGQKSERKKWFQLFKVIEAVIFVASLTEYDQVLEEDGKTNRMEESLRLFNEICKNSSLKNTNVMLFLNKKDILSFKLRNVQFSKSYPSFTGRNNFYEVAKHIQAMYENQSEDKLIYTHMTCATDKNNLAVVFNAVQDYILFSRLKSIGVL